MFSRDRKTPIAEWWWTIDRQLLAGLLLLMAVGMVLSFAASPPVAERLGYDEWHFIIRHAMFSLLAVPVLIGASMLSPRHARFAALGVLVVSIVLLWLALKFGTEIKGARRWLSLFGNSIQPSEFVKPAFAVIGAWLFSEAMQQKGVPARIIATKSGIAAAGSSFDQPPSN